MALLFSEGHFPTVASGDGAVQSALGALVRECRLNQVMVEAAVRGSIGSACVLMRVLKGRIFLEVLDTVWLTPTWDPEAPDTLLRVVERYKAPGSDLVAAGYEGVDAAGTYWFQRRWDVDGETWFLPQAVGEVLAARVDEVRSVRHGLGFVPLVWIRNLPGGVAPDGGCTFRAAVETGIEIGRSVKMGS